MKAYRILLIAALSLTGSANAAEWHVGAAISIVTGADDVSDLYEDNLEAQGFLVESVDLLPVGIAFDAHYQWDNGLRVGLGFGPSLLLYGDVEHFELPFNGTIGYTFLPNGNVSPYVKAGFVHHIVSGDFEDGASPGLLAGVGIEFARQGRILYALEVSTDQSEVKFDRITCPTRFTCRTGTVKLNTFDTLISFSVKF